MGKCKVCGDSGETMFGSGIYDCSEVGCNSAIERTTLEESTEGVSFLHPADALWIGYQAAKASMLGQIDSHLLETIDFVRANTVSLK